MFDWLRGSEEQKNQKSNASFGDINLLYLHVSNTLSAVEGIRNDLSSEYSTEALSMISRRFEEISKEYSDFTIITSNSFYEVIHRSSLRSSSTKKVAQQAKSVAKLFEKYAKKPKSYSAVESRYSINELVGVLKNLQGYCTPDTSSD